MFIMKCLLSINSTENNEPIIRSIKPSAVSLKRSVKDLIDTAEITLPLTPYLRQDNTDGTVLQERGIVFNVGDRVTISMGYDDDVTQRFEGFIASISKSTPMKLYCEGYAYQLRNTTFNKSYTNTTLKQLLADLCAGTDIVISPHTADIPLPNIFFKNTPALKVLEWVQKELLCRVWFDGRQLYAGASLYALPKPSVKFSLGYNTVKDDELQQNTDNERVQITLVEKEKSGTTKKVKDITKKYSATKEIKVRPGLPTSFKNTLVAELQKLSDHRGYEGNITAFLTPYVDKAYTIEVLDDRYPERAGRYFAESVNTSYSPSGGRQTINLIYYGK